jgi:uncharacterized Fe-S cluster-containing radical SAM superfamily protein
MRFPKGIGLTSPLLSFCPRRRTILPNTSRRHAIRFHKGGYRKFVAVLVDSNLKCEYCYKYNAYIRTEAA